MPMNRTPNYNLSQWELTDKIQMSDFNADNAKIDAALKAGADARAALSAAVAKLGNCQIWVTTYRGTGACGKDHPTSLTFPKKPLLAAIDLGVEIAWILPRDGYLCSPAANILSWSGNTATWYNNITNPQPHYQLNTEGANYWVLALLAADQ